MHKWHLNFFSVCVGASMKMVSKICGLVWQKGTYSLSNRVTLWPHRIKRLKYISLKFSQITLLRCWSLMCKMHWHRPCRKKVISSQSQRSGKAISPFLSDRVTYMQVLLEKALLLHFPPSQIWTASSSSDSWMDGTCRIPRSSLKPPLTYLYQLVNE